jgi:hypothetical protein
MLPKMMKRQDAAPTATFVADFCAKDFPAGAENLAKLCTTVKTAVATGVQQQQLADVIQRIKDSTKDIATWQGAVQAKADQLKTTVENCKTKLGADVAGAMVETDFQNKVAACQTIGAKVKAMVPTFQAGAMLPNTLPADLLADVKLCQTELQSLREKFQAKLTANAAECPGLTNVFTCVKRAVATLKFKSSSLLGCAETLVDGLQNGIAMFKTHVDAFCADAAHKAICEKFQPIFNSAEAALVDAAEPMAGDVDDALCRRAGTLKLRFPDPAAMGGMMKRQATNVDLKAGLVNMCAGLTGCEVEDESVETGTPLKTEKSASGQQVDGVDNVVVPPTQKPSVTDPSVSSASSMIVAGVAFIVSFLAAL